MLDDLNAELVALQSRVARLEAVENARAVSTGYAHAVDSGDLDRVRDLYANDVVVERLGAIDEPGVCVGWAEVERVLLGSGSDERNEGRHLISTTTVQRATLDEVELLSHFVAFRVRDGRVVLHWGDNHDTVRRVDGNWKFVERRSNIERRLSFAMSGKVVDY